MRLFYLRFTFRASESKAEARKEKRGKEDEMTFGYVRKSSTLFFFVDGPTHSSSFIPSPKIVSRGHTTLELAMSVSPPFRLLVGRFVDFLKI